MITTVGYPWLEASLAALLAMRESMPHALLIHGPAGLGKTALAEALAAAMLCEAPGARGEACGRCPACGWFAQDNHPDIRHLSPGSDEDTESREKASREIKIGQVRGLAGFLSVGAHRGGRKVVLVDPADALNTPAANALLKTLEEPPGDTVFLLVSARPDGLPATIRSRCVAVAVTMPAPETVRDWLVQQVELDATRDPAWGIDAWLAAAGGAPLRALGLADPEASSAHRHALAAFAEVPGQSPLRVAEALSGVAPRDWLPVLQGWVADLGRVLAGAPPRRYPGQASRLSVIAKETSVERLSGFEGWLRRQAPLTAHPLNARLFCEDVALRYAALFRAHSGPTR